MRATLRTRLDRLEAKHGGADAGPTVIFLCDATTGEPGGALVMGGGGLVREPGESADTFTARASDGVSGAVYLPDNGRDALATGKAPAWVKNELTLRALHEKHADTDYKKGRKRKAKGV
jgi:hypothetical protein